jgi:hypothetical protein
MDPSADLRIFLRKIFLTQPWVKGLVGYQVDYQVAFSANLASLKTLLWPTTRAIRHTISHRLRLGQEKPTKAVDPASQRRQVEREEVGVEAELTPSRAEIRTRDRGAHGNRAHQLSYRFTLSHISMAPPQLESHGTYSCFTNRAPDMKTFGTGKSSPRRSLSQALQRVASDGTCSKKNPTIHHCHRVSGENKRVTSSFKPRCSSNKSSVDRSHSRVTPEQRTGSTRVN